MTETKATLGTCEMGKATPAPCPYPATVEMPGADYAICSYHAATEPLVRESDDMAVCLELVRAYIKGARKTTAAGELVEALERIEADFERRHALAEAVLADLQAAEYRLMRR